MKKVLYQMFVRPWKHYLIAFGVAALLTGTVFLISPNKNMMALSNAISVAGALVLFGSALILVANAGAFDTFGYAFSFLRKHRYKDMVEFTEARQGKRRGRSWNLVPYLLVGFLFLAVGTILSYLI